MMRRGCALWLGLLLAGGPVDAHAGPAVLSDARAQQHFATAQRHFDSEEYAEAIPELKAAYALEPNPLLLYAWAQAERLAGNCARAVELYRRFLDSEPDPEQAGLAEANVVDCEASQAPSDDQGATDRDGPAREARPWYADPLGDTGVALGAGVVIVGGVVYGIGRRDVARAYDASTEQGYYDLAQQARPKHIAGATLLGLGVGMIALGVLRWILVGTRERRAARGPSATARTPSSSPSNVHWAPTVHATGRAAGLSISGRF